MKLFYTSIGVAAILSQFNISHFRAIAWYNVALGVAFVVLELLMFHGESKCPDLRQGCNCTMNWKRGKIDVTLILVSFTLQQLFSLRVDGQLPDKSTVESRKYVHHQIPIRCTHQPRNRPGSQPFGIVYNSSRAF